MPTLTAAATTQHCTTHMEICGDNFYFDAIAYLPPSSVTMVANNSHSFFPLVPLGLIYFLKGMNQSFLLVEVGFSINLHPAGVRRPESVPAVSVYKTYNIYCIQQPFCIFTQLPDVILENM